MGSAIRFTGLSSGIDTSSVVTAMMTQYQNKIDTLNKKQVLAEWRKDAYKEMSTKIQNFRSNAVSKLKYASSLKASKVEMSQEGCIKMDTSNYKEDGTHKIEVTKLAQEATAKTNTIKDKYGKSLTKDSLFTEIKGMEATKATALEVNGISVDITGKTISEVETAINNEFSKKGIEIGFKFDESSGAFLINSKDTGEEQSIDLSGNSTDVLSAMGVKSTTDKDGKATYVYNGQNAEVVYNGGVTISSATNNDIEVNGVKFTALSVSNGAITVNISKDVDGIVDTFTNFVKEYNSLLEEINTMLYADSAKGYEPLTDEEKESMTESEIEKWESKIKSSLLRNDSTLKDLSSMLRNSMMTGYKESDGLDESCCMLSQLGISSSSWTDKGKLTINEEKLRVKLSENSDGVTKLLTTIANKIDKELTQRSATTELRSYGQFFSDKILTNNISKFKTDIITAQERYDAKEEYYYKKFSAMETAMNNMNSQSSLFG